MSGIGAGKSHGLQWSLGGMVAFAWQPEGFLVYERKVDGSLGVRPDRLINQFAQNNYPDRDGIKEELLADGRIAEELRINTEDYKIVIWPPVERPVYPAFDEASDGEDQDPKTKEGKFNSNKITAHLKLRKPKDWEPAIGEAWYPTEAKTAWCLHAPEYITYRPEEGELVPNRFDRIVCDYILEYTNALREHAPFHPPLRGEYSPASFIVQFDEKLGYIAHNDEKYPEDYQLTQERIEKTHQFPEWTNQFQTLPIESALQYQWWWAENIQQNDVAEKKAQAEEPEDEEKRAQMVAHAVVNFWKTSPSHYANMVRFDTAAMKDMALLDLAKKNEYYAQVFMAPTYWLQAGNCYWEGNESWKVLSWYTHKVDRYSHPVKPVLFFRGRVLFKTEAVPYVQGAVVGAAISADHTTLIIALTPKVYWVNALGVLRPVGYETIHIFQAEFKPNKIYQQDDLTLVYSYTIEQGIVGGEAVSNLFLQSLFFNAAGTKAVTRGQVVYGENEDQISSTSWTDGYMSSTSSSSQIWSAKRQYVTIFRYESNTITPDLSYIYYTTATNSHSRLRNVIYANEYNSQVETSVDNSEQTKSGPSVLTADYKNSELLVCTLEYTGTTTTTSSETETTAFIRFTVKLGNEFDANPLFRIDRTGFEENQTTRNYKYRLNATELYVYDSVSTTNNSGSSYEYYVDAWTPGGGIVPEAGLHEENYTTNTIWRDSGINYVASVDLRHPVFIVHDAPSVDISTLVTQETTSEGDVVSYVNYSDYYRIHSPTITLSSITKSSLDVDQIGFGFNSVGNDWASAVSVEYDSQYLIAFYMPNQYIKLYATHSDILQLFQTIPNVFPIARI